MALRTMTSGRFLDLAREITDYVGVVFNRWTVVAEAERDKFGNRRFHCKCMCGASREVPIANLTSSKSKSCGCLNRELAGKLFKTHGKSKTREYRIWAGMISRCHDVNSSSYSRYGGRGIFVCSRWRNSFENFLSDMGERPSPSHSIDRINNEKGYSPENCRWADPFQQARNKRPRPGKSGIPGVYWRTDRQRWVAVYRGGERPKKVGSFKDKREAERALNEYVSNEG